MRREYKRLLTLAMAVSLTGCSTISGWFDSDDDDPTAPMDLVKIEQTVKVKKLWSAGVGDGQGDGLYRIQPAISGDVIYAASAEGRVRACDSHKGKSLWKVELDAPQ
jgi:outer membrane protein assembly factor BamB